jgi:hypothetical protein
VIELPKDIRKALAEFVALCRMPEIEAAALKAFIERVYAEGQLNGMRQAREVIGTVPP